MFKYATEGDSQWRGFPSIIEHSRYKSGDTLICGDVDEKGITLKIYSHEEAIKIITGKVENAMNDPLHCNQFTIIYLPYVLEYMPEVGKQLNLTKQFITSNVFFSLARIKRFPQEFCKLYPDEFKPLAFPEDYTEIEYCKAAVKWYNQYCKNRKELSKYLQIVANYEAINNDN